MKNGRPPTLLLTAKQTNKHHMKKSKTNNREKSGTRRECFIRDHSFPKHTHTTK
jgi:hypothetical protein